MHYSTVTNSNPASQKTHPMAPCRNISQNSIWITACWKRSQEDPQPCGLVISGTVLCVPRGPDSDSCLCSEKGKALSLLRSLLSAAGRAVTGDATVSASLCFMALVKAVQGAGSRVRVRREWAEEGVRGQALMEDTSQPWAAVWLTSAGVRKQGDDGAAESYDCCLMCVLARCIWMLSERATTHWAFDHFAGGCWRKRDVLRAFTHPEREKEQRVSWHRWMLGNMWRGTAVLKHNEEYRETAQKYLQ